MKKQSILSLCLLPLFLFGEERIQNGSFSDGLNHWSIPPAGTEKSSDSILDTAESVTPSSASVRLERRDLNASAWRPYLVQKNIVLEPNTEYEIACYIKGKDLVETPKSGAFIAISAENKTLHYGNKGLWKYDTGTFGWTRVRHQFNSNYFEGKAVSVSCGIRATTGTAWFDEISLKKVKKNHNDKLTFTPVLYPFNFLKKIPFGICENLPGMLEFSGRGKLKDPEKKAVLTLELPEFLTLAGVSEGIPVTRDGKRIMIAQTVSESAVTRNGKAYRRYVISFEKKFNTWFAVPWYTQRIFLNAVKGSVGRKGDIYWSLKVGQEQTAEEKGAVEVLPPVKTDFKPCDTFEFMISCSGAQLSPFPELAAKMTDFYRSLVTTPYVMNGTGFGDRRDAGYKNVLLLGGNDLLFPYPETKNALENFQKQAPRDMDSKGTRTRRYSANWYKLDDVEKKFETYLRNAIRHWRKTSPEITIAVWDFEPGPHGMDEQGRARFAKAMKLSSVPSTEEINRKYKRQWLDYMISLHAEYVAKVAKIFREEAPGTQLWLCSDNLQSGAGRDRVAAWCAVDVALSDSFVDTHMHMPYYTGLRYFDDVRYNVESLKKPFFPLNDPAERLLSFYQQYTPEKLYQNIIATAALGGAGFGLWPDDTLTGQYFHVLASAYRHISEYGDFYRNGTRAEQKYSFRPKNTIAHEVTAENGRKIKITFPDFSKTLRTIVHEKGKDVLFTLFNYDEKQPVILEVSGKGKPFLVKVPPNGVEIVHSSKIPDQKILEKECKISQEKNQAREIFREISSGKSSILWSADPNGVPVLKLTDGKLNLMADVLGNGELTALRDADGNELLKDGYLGKFSWYDPGQPKLSFRLKDQKIEQGVPVLISETVVPPYDGANPEQNPLMGLRVERTFRIEPDQIRVLFRITNPTSHRMEFGFRIGNFPQVGKRFGTKHLTVNIGKEKVLPAAPTDNLFFRRGADNLFLPNQKSQIWDGAPVTISAKDGVLKEEMTFIPGNGFDGIYCWNGSKGMTVEFLTGKITLEPGQSIQRQYQIRTGR